jgi:hypothetical protein
MKNKRAASMKPRIFVEFKDNECKWYSDGWGNDEKLMRKARRAIENGLNPSEVVEGLKATFQVEVLEWSLEHLLGVQ